MSFEVITRDPPGGVVAVAGVDVVLPSIIALAGECR